MLLASKQIEVHVSEPKLVGKAEDTLQFSLFFCMNGANFMEIKGFTVRNKMLSCPSYRSPKGRYFPIVDIPDNFKTGLEARIRDLWQNKYPQIAFPGEEVVVAKGDSQ